MKKYVLIDLVFIVGLTIILVVMNEFESMEIVKSYPFPILYGCYLIGRLSVKVANMDSLKQKIKL